MSELAMRFGEAARKCRSLTALGSLLEGTSKELGFQYFALLDHSSLISGAPNLIRLDNYPRDWAQELVRRGFARNDPVHLACRRTHQAFPWSRIGRIVSLGAIHRSILAASRRFGIGGGFTVPLNVPGEPAGSCSFAVPRGADLPVKRLMCAELIGARALEAARRLSGRTGPRPVPRLSRRELECLRLIASGKTDWEIAHILGISTETARQYVKSARASDWGRSCDLGPSIRASLKRPLPRSWEWISPPHRRHCEQSCRELETRRNSGMDDDIARAAQAKKGSPFLSTEQAAFYLGLSARKLQQMRGEGRGPTFRRHSRYVRYHIDDLDDWSRGPSKPSPSNV